MMRVFVADHDPRTLAAAQSAYPAAQFAVLQAWPTVMGELRSFRPDLILLSAAGGEGVSAQQVAEACRTTPECVRAQLVGILDASDADRILALRGAGVRYLTGRPPDPAVLNSVQHAEESLDLEPDDDGEEVDTRQVPLVKDASGDEVIESLALCAEALGSRSVAVEQAAVLVSHACRHVSVERGQIFHIPADGRGLQQLADTNSPGLFAGPVAGTVDPAVQQVLATESAVAVDQQAPSQLGAPVPYQAVLALPIFHRGRVAGVLHLSHSQPRGFSAEAKRLARAYAGLAGAVLSASAFLDGLEAVAPPPPPPASMSSPFNPPPPELMTTIPTEAMEAVAEAPEPLGENGAEDADEMDEAISSLLKELELD